MVKIVVNDVKIGIVPKYLKTLVSKGITEWIDGARQYSSKPELAVYVLIQSIHALMPF